VTLSYTVRPISTDDLVAAQRTASAFTVTWHQALALLEREIDMLNGKNVVIELDVLPGQLTKVGQLRANTKARGNAVRVVFDSVHGQLAYGTSEFVRGAATTYRGGDKVTKMPEDWQHNVYAIARSLEAFRQADRYGVSKRGQQYVGFAELGPGRGGIAMGGLTHDQALIILENNAQGAGPTDGFTVEQLYRRARARCHPDRHEGNRALWDEVEEAATVLGVRDA
jgi:hypothetical protein